jgi:hypothetical protein
MENGSRAAQANKFARSHLQNNQSKMDWKHGSCDKRVKALSSNPNPQQKEKQSPKSFVNVWR